MTSVPDGEWDLPPRVSADLIQECLDDLRSGTSLRIGTGQTVPASYSQTVMRALFADALYRLAPQTTHDLVCDEAYEVIIDEYRALGEWFKAPHDRRPLDEAESRKDRYIDAWQRRHRLPDAWLHDAAEMTMHRAFDLYRSHGKTYDAPLVLPGATALGDLHDIPAHRPSDIPAHLHRLINTFNPRIETADDAVRRMLSVLEPQLLVQLMSIADDDRTLNGAQHPKTYRKRTAYEWLVRYQVLGGSRQEIAGTDRIDRAQVSRQVNETARRIGLTLREERGGRPRLNHGPPKVCVWKPTP